ncbi:hypothetical protein [Alkalitalea saponilacus]|uniref:Uncharacterized protein n=1 Tax=Alkalitalea saponilacus TaxID=889453 RepID=A0A1T5GDH3_9BACT|nr:hypothetical protein [Alkalitalea saponilacus]ASB47935.1 hypothetical protein CDL62_01600 [Alkalitalea saponilacus]SKC06412.1 hypothetical protein SAMN03080601_01823 [Alkalitalea saponilacus]
MKKKLIFAIATGFFAVATVVNMNMLQADSAGDVTLESIATMAQAQVEWGGSNGICMNIPWGWCLWDDGFFINGIFI